MSVRKEKKEETEFAEGDFRNFLPRLTHLNRAQNLKLLDIVKDWAMR